jgi:hypothetical protein
VKHENNPPCWREAKAWAEDQEAGDSVAAWLVVLIVTLSALGWWLL